MDLYLFLGALILLAAACAVVLTGRAGRKGERDEDARRFSALESSMRDEFARAREESTRSSRENREELSNFLKNQFETFTGQQESMRRAMDYQLGEIREETRKKLDEMRTKT